MKLKAVTPLSLKLLGFLNTARSKQVISSERTNLAKEKEKKRHNSKMLTLVSELSFTWSKREFLGKVGYDQKIVDTKSRLKWPLHDTASKVSIYVGR